MVTLERGEGWALGKPLKIGKKIFTHTGGGTLSGVKETFRITVFGYGMYFPALLDYKDQFVGL